MKLTKRRRQILKQKAIGLAMVIFSVFFGLKFGEIGTIAVLIGMVGVWLICIRKTIDEIIKEGISEEVKQLKRENEDL